jgi:hypothetical protein
MEAQRVACKQFEPAAVGDHRCADHRSPAVAPCLQQHARTQEQFDHGQVDQRQIPAIVDVPVEVEIARHDGHRPLQGVREAQPRLETVGQQQPGQAQVEVHDGFAFSR